MHEGVFASGGSDGAIMFWNVGEDKESGVIENAHESIVWSLAWHPIGHILCSGSNDHTAKFWDVLISHSFVIRFLHLHFVLTCSVKEWTIARDHRLRELASRGQRESGGMIRAN